MSDERSPVGGAGDRARRGLAGGRFERLEWVDETDSTNAQLMGRARHGEPEGAVLVADHQTAGRGRLGRSWIAPPGASLLASVLVRPEATWDRPQLLTVALALAAADACQRVAGVDAELKWPNDLLVGARKVAGILAESVIEGDRPTAVVIGIGINVNWPQELPPEIAQTATALNLECGREVDREDLLVEVLSGFDRRYDAGNGVIEEYRARCATLGRDVRVDLGGGVLEGRATGLADDGRLLVIATDGTEHVLGAADVVHLRT